MKDFNLNHFCQPTEAEIKKNSDKNEIHCECLPLFTNHHCIQCSLANKICPAHRAFFSYGTKDDKLPAEQERIVISFQPSQKTDRLLQPIKSILMNNCNSEAKINFQYFSPKSLNKAMVRNKQIQTSSQGLKTHFGGSYLVEKTKSYVADTTNKMKKLKQCFYSPCNSVEKSQSQVSVKKDKRVQNIFISTKKIMEKNDSQECRKSNRNVCYCYDNLVTSDTEKSGVSDSDVLTVNKNLKPENAVDHKLFKLNHSKNLVSFNKSNVDKTQLVFFSTVKDQNEKTQQITNVKGNEKYKELESDDKKFSSKELIMKDKEEESEKYGSEKSQSDSSGSVYFTPFILVPEDVRKSDSDSKSRQNSEILKANKEIQLDAKLENEEPSLFMSTCSSPFFLINKDSFGKEADNLNTKQKPFEEETHTSHKLSSNNFYLTSTEMLKSELKSLVAEVIKEKKSSDTRNESTQYPSPSLSSVFHVIKKEGTETTSEEYLKYLNTRCNEKAMQTGKDFCKPSSSTKTSWSIAVCTCDSISSNFTSDLNLFKKGKLEKANELSQVDSKLIKDFELKGVELKQIKRQTEAISPSAASVQMLEIKLDEWTQTEDDFQMSKLIDLNESNFSRLTYVKKSSLSQESSSGLKEFSRPLSQKFHSDGELCYKSKCECIKTVNEITLPLTRQEIGKEPIIDSVGTSENSKALDVIIDSASKQKSTSEADNYGSIQLTDPKKTKKVDPKECGVNTSFSDLSELRKIINDNFDKMFEEALRIPTSRCDRGVQTDNSNVLLKIKNIESKLLDIETQTSEGLFQLFESKATPVLMTKTNHVCMNCTKQGKIFVDVGTYTEDSTKIEKIDAETFYELIQIKTVKNIEDTQQSKRFENCTTDKTIRKSFIKPLQSSTEKQAPVKKDYCKTQKPVPAPRKSIALKPECPKGSEGITSRARQSRRLDNSLQSKMKTINNQRKSKTVNFNLSSQQSTSGTSEKSTMQTFQSDCICEAVLKPVNPYVGRSNYPTTGRGITKKETNTPKPKTRPITYPVVINSIWPQILAEYLEEKDVAKDKALLAKSRTLSKRNLPADDFTETPTEKKIKNETVGSVVDMNTKSQKSFVFGKTQINKSALRKNTELVCPSSLSAPQFFTLEKDTICSCVKILKSEEQIHHKTATKPIHKTATIPSVVDFRELFTVKSFEHTNMSQYVEEELSPKLYKCTFCKSLTYLKPKKFYNSNPLRKEEIAHKFLEKENDSIVTNLDENLLKDNLKLPGKNEFSKTELLEHEFLNDDSQNLWEQQEQQTWTDILKAQNGQECEENIEND